MWSLASGRNVRIRPVKGPYRSRFRLRMRTESPFLRAQGAAKEKSARVPENFVEIVRERYATGPDAARQPVSYGRHNLGRFGMDVRIVLQVCERGAEIKRCVRKNMAGGGRNTPPIGFDLQYFEPE